MSEVKILLVEDSRADADAARLAIEKAPDIAPLVTVVDTLEAARLELRQPYDVVLLDLSLPDSEGLDTVKAILKVTEAPVIVHSAEGHSQVVRMAMRAGAVDYLVKDGPPDEVVRAVKHAIERHYHVQQLKDHATALRKVVLGFIEDRHPTLEALGKDVSAFAMQGERITARSPAAAKILVGLVPGEIRRLEVASKETLRTGSIVTKQLQTGHHAMLVPHPSVDGQVLCLMVEGTHPKGEQRETQHDLSHHFKTPLTPILLDLKRLIDGSDDETRPLLNRIEQNTIRLKQFGEDYVDATALAAGSIPMHRERFDLSPRLKQQFPNCDYQGQLVAIGDPTRTERLLEVIHGHVPDGRAAARVGDGQVVVEIESPWQGKSAEELLTPFGVVVEGVDPAGLGLHIGKQTLLNQDGDLEIETKGDAILFRLRLQADKVV